MKRTPIISVGQVYLHPDNEYIVVTKSMRGNITYRAPGFGGMHEMELFLERFGPVDPADLTELDKAILLNQLDLALDREPGDKITHLSVGWVKRDDDEDDDGDE